MCGIVGVVGGSRPSRTPTVQAMLAALEHRGPDNEGVLDFAESTLGARRLAIIDVPNGNQPVTNEDGSIAAVQNGEIYNFTELRDELRRRGHVLRTNGDSEVLPHLYEEFGEDFVSRLRGMFAIALWDERRKTLLLARDRLGKKPLAYARLPRGEFAFASEIQALLRAGAERTVRDAALVEYLQFGYVLAPRSAFAAIRKVRPAEIVVLRDGELRDREYWRLGFTPKIKTDEPEAIERLRTLLTDAVKLRMQSDVPLGVFLSGGLDSSSVVAIMAASSDRPVKTFSVGFDERDFDELRYARLVARQFATQHEEIIVRPSSLDALSMLVRHLGDPFADASVIPTYYVARAARTYVTVALNGDGGDEIFGGYDRYRAALVAARLDALPAAARSALRAIASQLPTHARTPRLVRRARRLLSDADKSPEARYAGWSRYFTHDAAIFGPRLQDVRAESVELDLRGRSAGTLLDDLIDYDMRTNLPGDLLVKADIATMAASLEARSPFLDHEVVDYVTRLPAGLKYRSGQQKYLLRRLMAGVLPPEILRRRKMGFGVPVGTWFRGTLTTFAREMLLDAPDRGLLDRSEVERLFAAHASGTADHTYKIWCLVMLELWFRHVVEGTTANEQRARSPAVSVARAVSS